MKMDYDGLRLSIARSFNDLAATDTSEEQRDIMREMRAEIGGLLACYDPNDDEVNAIHEQIELTKV